ncbi:MAG TPA: Crp/Fnr family transcriptional regulator [Clostridiales bacterium UBA8960]|jgi:CRP/FNR family transcriptional regulator|nr:Crp/Fnr family transcriptional regulator [Clostridiales bacterium UBA8960]
MKNIHSEHFDVNGCISCGHSLCAKKVSLFSNLNETELQSVIDLIERKHYKKGETIMHAGDPFDRLFIVNKGTLKASSFGEDGKEQILYLLSDGDFIGELALLRTEFATYDLVCIKESFLCTIPKSKFDHYLKQNPEILFSIMTSAHEKIASLEKLVSAIASNDADIRLKFLLKQLIGQSKSSDKSSVVISLNITREDMANFVGVTRETISRKLSQLAQENILELMDSKHIRIKNLSYFE